MSYRPCPLCHRATEQPGELCRQCGGDPREAEEITAEILRNAASEVKTAAIVSHLP